MQSSEQFDRWILRSTRDGLWVFDGQGRTTYANDRLAQILGRSVQEMGSLSVFDTLDEPGREQFRDHLAQLTGRHDGVDNVECSLLRGDGTRIWVLVTYSPLLDDAGARRGWLYRVTELTERKLLLDNLSSSEQQLAEAQAIAKIGSWEWDVPHDVVTWSDELYRLFNLDPQQFAATYAGFLEYVHPEDRGVVEAAVGGAFTGPYDSFEFEARMIKYGGDEMWTHGRGKVVRDEAGAPVRMSGTSQDITESMLAARKLAETSARLEVLHTMTAAANEAQQLGDAVEIAMVELARHTGWTARAAYTVDDVGELVVMDLACTGGSPPANASAGHRALQAVATRDVVWGRETSETDPSGSLAIPVVVNGAVVCVLEFAAASPAPQPDILETMRHVAGQLGRVAERDSSARQLAAARDAALEASGMKSDFLARMSHEIRTPMNGVIGLTGLLLTTELDERQRQYVQGVHSAGEGLLAIINDILDFSKIEAGRLELETIDFNLVQVVEEAAELVAQEAQRKGLELFAYCSPEVPAGLRGDPSRIRQVLLNLVSNAVKFTQAGEVVMRAHLDGQASSGPVVRFEVTDTGIGISDAERHRLFDPFSQADSSTTRRFGGTGLGLAISRQLVTAMGGTMGVDSEPGQGSTFWFTLPLGAARDQAPPPPGAGDELAGVRTLVVDASQTSRVILTEQLEAWGMRPDAVADGATALARMAQAADSGDPYLLALLDLRMPGMNGLELARTISTDARFSDTGLVLLSSGPQVGVERARGVGISTWLSKPVHLSQLRTALESARDATEPQRGAQVPPAGPTEHLGHVLVVEDNHVNQMVAVGILERLGYTCEVAGNGYEALAALDRSDFVAVLMDCQMPEMDGYDATRAIRARGDGNRRIPVIAMTASATEGEREKCQAAGMDDFLTKPVNSRTMASTIERWARHDGPPAASPPAAEPAPREVLDQERLHMFRTLKPDDTSFLDRVIESFVDSAPQGLARIRDAVSIGSPPELVQAAHWLAGSALNIGAPRVAAACEDLQLLGLTNDLEQAAEAVAGLADEIARAASALRALQASSRYRTS